MHRAYRRATAPRPFWRPTAAIAIVAVLAGRMCPAAEAVTLVPATWDAYALAGKEVDCIYGDLVLKSDRLAAVIARPVEGRRANMTVRNVGGCLIDLTRVERQSDQLSAYYPGGLRMNWRSWRIIPSSPPTAVESVDLKSARVRAEKIVVELESPPLENLPAAKLRYTLADGVDYLLVETTYINTGKQPLTLELYDDLRADAPFDKAPTGEHSVYWVYDKWFGQAYGFASPG